MMSSQLPRPVSEPLPCDVLLTLHKQYGLVPTAVSTLVGGHQSNAFRLDCGAQRVVLKLGPCWRSSAELEWSYTAAEHVAQVMAVAAIPLRTTAKARVVRVGGRPMTVWPYVEGRGIDVSSDKECDLTAAVLGRMQARLATWRGPGARPATSPFALAMRRPARVPEALRDAGLDRWLTRWRAGRGRLQGPMHGDFWGNNVLFDGHRIAAVIDWDDTRVGSLDRELAWAVWEFCGNPGLAALDGPKACRFLARYASGGGPVPVADRSFVVPLIREHLRYEALRALGAAEHGEIVDHGYTASAIRAFAALRGQSLGSVARPRQLRPKAVPAAPDSPQDIAAPACRIGRTPRCGEQTGRT